MDVIKNAWEVDSDENMMLALTGHTRREEYLRDREERAREVLSYCGVEAHHVGFEIGSGDGTVARILSGHCRRLDCNDISQQFLETARGHCADCANVAFHKIESDYLDFLPAEAYDFGYSLNVFIHFNPYDIYHYLSSVHKILRPGGVFMFDASHLGSATWDLFFEHAEIYRQHPETIRGVMNFNHPSLIQTVIEKVGLHVSKRSMIGDNGWMKIIVTK